jgi:aspartate aminotransferase
MLAKRVAAVDASGIRKVFDLAQQMKDPVNLSIGQPDFDVPGPIKEDAKKFIDDGFNSYTVTQGIEELREKIRDNYSQQGIEIDDLFVTAGVSGGILLSLMVLVDEGDEVLVPDPYFVMYKHLIKLLGAVPKYIDTYPDFKLRPGKIEEMITEKTKVIFVNTPANPTGVSMGAGELEQVAGIAKKHNLTVIFDEIYSSFNYGGPHANIARYYDNTIILNGFSKSHAMTGWRIGYATGPAHIIREMIKLQQYTFVCAPSFVQRAAVKAIDYDMTEYIDRYRRKRDLIYDGLKDKFEVTKPDGAFYIFPKAPGNDGEKFVKKAIENNLLIIPGNIFSEKNTHFRISFAATDDTIGRGLEILNKLA